MSRVPIHERVLAGVELLAAAIVTALYAVFVVLPLWLRDRARGDMSAWGKDDGSDT